MIMDAGAEVNVRTDIGEQRLADTDLGWFAFSTHFAAGYRYVLLTTARLMSSCNTACCLLCCDVLM